MKLLSSDTPNEPSVIHNYTVYRCDKDRGGGVCLYVKDMYKANPVEFNTAKPQGVEDVRVAVPSCTFPTVIVGCLYRHLKSHSHTYDYINDIISSVRLKNKSFYILGDFNNDLLSSNSKLK